MTHYDLRMVLLVATVFVVVLNVYRQPAQIKRLLMAISIIGALIAVLAAYQNATGTRMIYGIVPMVHPNSGPFLNHSHFGQFMNLCIGAMLCLLLVRVAEITRGTTSFADSYQRLNEVGLGFAWLLGGVIAFAALMIFLSLTRGAVVALIVAGALTAILYAWRAAKSIQSVLAILVFAILLGVLFAAFGTVYQRLVTLRHVSSDSGLRTQVLSDLAHHAWAKFPIFGTGLGTHQFVFPMFDSSTTLAQATHAENEFAELMEECGAIGVGLCFAFLAMIAFQYSKCIGRPQRSIQYAAYGLGFGLLAILIHSLSDFGQHVMVNAMLTSTYFGLLISLARLSRRSDKTVLPSVTLDSIRIPLRLAFALVVIGLFVLPLHGAFVNYRKVVAWKDVLAQQGHIEQQGWNNASDADCKRLLIAATNAAEIEPRDVRTHFWLNDFRWQTISRRHDQQGRMVLSRAGMGFAERIADELDSVRVLCPTFAPPVALEGSLRYFVLHEPGGGLLVRQGYLLDPCDPMACYGQAEMFATEGKWDACMAQTTRVIELDPGWQDRCLDLFVGHGRPDLAYLMVQDNQSGLASLAQMLEADPAQQELAERCKRRATKMLLAAAEEPDASPEMLAGVADLYRTRGEDRKAIEMYERALARRYAQVDWRLHLAELLAKAGDAEGALREARTCLRQSPDLQAAKELIEADGRPSAAD
jgi:hypothetical protein